MRSTDLPRSLPNTRRAVSRLTPESILLEMPDPA
jgi:hypothetical protein